MLLIVLFNLLLATESLPDAIKGIGLVVVGSNKCKHSKKLMDFLNMRRIPYRPVFIENDIPTRNYILVNKNGKIPWVYQNGQLLGTGDEYMKMVEGSAGQYNPPNVTFGV